MVHENFRMRGAIAAPTGCGEGTFNQMICTDEGETALRKIGEMPSLLRPVCAEFTAGHERRDGWELKEGG